MRRDRRTADMLALAFTMGFPCLLTWVYFVLLADRPAAVQQGAYAVGKVVQFAFPLVWVVLVAGQRLQWQAPSRAGVNWGVSFGLLVAIAMVGGYFGLLRQAGFMSDAGRMVQAKVAGLGLGHVASYAAVGLFYALGHSLLEEYYWRWFVFGQLRLHMREAAANGLSSAAFMAHHVILLATFFGWDSPVAYTFSLCVGMGGVAWAWIYARSGSLYGPWISHCFVDAAIFLIGYDLARELFVG